MAPARLRTPVLFDFLRAVGVGQNKDVPPPMTLARTFDAPSPLRRGEALARLRAATADAHGGLERSLDLLGRVGDRQRFVRVLERFFGFHLAWERAIRQHPAIRVFHEPRSRLPHLRRDLSALGRTHAELARLPLCVAAAGLAKDEAGAIGSIYVMEGSTLGGQVIARALASADWRPAGGLTYFEPYRARTGEMWRGFGVWAETSLAADDHVAAAGGANRTFSLLQEWLTS